ncbi:MAG TPA: hypothetical protein VK171_12550, partial [Fimbriimonas sp.]|nr:hypothetical protein [Fimbriimonas sp.]
WYDSSVLCWATCSTLPEPDVDEELFFGACRDRGIPIRLLRWDDPDDMPSPDEIVLIRSTWNYPWHVNEFRDWIRRTSLICQMANPSHILLQNLDKRYLSDLDVPIVPTEFITRGEEFDLPTEGKFVLKPTVGAGSFRTKVFESPSEDAVNFANTILIDSDLMIQPFMDSVHTVGEQSLVFIDGEFTHKIIKTPRFEGSEEKVSEALPLGTRDLEFGNRTIRALKSQLIYARVDVMELDGEWVLSELELTEPSLFLKQSRPALERLVDWAARIT